MLGPRLGVVAVAALVAATGCLSRPTTDPTLNFSPLPIGRPMYQMDPQHTGRSPHIGPRQPILLRTFDTSVIDVPDPIFGNSDIQSSAAIAPDGTAYIGLHSGTVWALRDPVGAGNQLAARWSFHPSGGSSWHATPAIARDGTVYVGFSTNNGTPDAQGTLYALQAPSAGIEPTVLWSVDLGPGRQTSSPLIGPDGTIYAMGGQGRLSAISPDGRVQWTAQTGPTLKSSPAMGRDGTVYVPSMNGKLYAVAPPLDQAQQSASSSFVDPAKQSAGAASVDAVKQSAGDTAKQSAAALSVDSSKPPGTIRWTFRFAEFPGKGKPVTSHSPPAGADWDDLHRRQQQQLLRDRPRRPSGMALRSPARDRRHLDDRRAERRQQHALLRCEQGRHLRRQSD